MPRKPTEPSFCAIYGTLTGPTNFRLGKRKGCRIMAGTAAEKYHLRRLDASASSPQRLVSRPAIATTTMSHAILARKRKKRAMYASPCRNFSGNGRFYPAPCRSAAKRCPVGAGHDVKEGPGMTQMGMTPRSKAEEKNNRDSRSEPLTASQALRAHQFSRRR